MSKYKYAISDIHGCFKTFKALLRKIKFSKKDELYLLGDYIDRGPNSKGVIDHIWHLQSDGYTVHCLKGNHEQMLLQSYLNFTAYRSWKQHGGFQTMQSFKAESLQEIPKEYLQWMRQLPHYLEVGEYILVHAGFKFDMPNPFDENEAMLWERNWYTRINKHWLGDRIIIHGHTPIKELEMKSQAKSIQKNAYLDIDNGCVFRRDGMRHLVAFEMTNRELIFQECLDKKM